MIRTTVFALTIGFFATGASAMPLLNQANAFAQSDNVIAVKIICEENGRCSKRGRKPVARWVYGEGNFSGPYVGPGYYGWPAHRSRWTPFWW